MKLKKIKLNNIRSYIDEEVRFIEGSTLLSGDIGSGKTSVLLGIEFALFGLQPGQRGSSLLRNGADQGGVVIDLEIGNQEFIIERTLKRGKTVSQDYCAITIDGSKQELSVMELKNKVLQILGYPSEFSKKQNMLYKFTVYTPQEEMKQIILENPETRVNTLRHIFGIDKYKRIIENASILASKLREERRVKEGMIDGLEDDKSNLSSKEEDLESKRHNLSSVEKELFSKSENKNKIQDEKDEISDKIEERRRLKQEIEKTKLFISNKNENISSNSNLIENLKKEIEELSTMEFDESKINQIEKQIGFLREEKEKLSQENLRITSEISSLNSRNSDNQELRNKITKIDICPTCLQGVDSVYKSNVINKIESDTTKNLNGIKKLEEEKIVIMGSVSKMNSDIRDKERELQELKILRVKFQGISEKRKRLEDVEKKNDFLEKDLEILNNQLETLTKSAFDLNKYENAFESKQREFEDAMKDERIAEIKVAELKKEIEVFSRQIEELKERIRKTEEIREKLNYIIKLETWISKSFSPLVYLTEKNVMMKLKREFSTLFSRWFSMLVSDTFEVSLDENFTPIIQQQGYDLDYIHLSGGERTAIALAYRLSLNQVVNSLLSEIKTRDIVILDEPTDGFSDMQLDKMRDVLMQLYIGQLIIVSHEQKIEGFVENVIRFKKEHSVSRVESEKFIK